MRLPPLLLAGLLAGCAHPGPQPERVPNPPATAVGGVVFLFNGLTLFFEGEAGTGTFTLTEKIRRAGVRAELSRPSAWQELADRVIRDWQAAPRPVAVYGYSYGANAALRFAGRLGEAGIPVETVVVVEAVRPPPVPCNVREAAHHFVPGLSLVGVAALVPERPGCTVARNLRFTATGPAPIWLDHLSISTLDEMHRTAQEQLLDGSRVRRRGTPISEGCASCSASSSPASPPRR